MATVAEQTFNQPNTVGQQTGQAMSQGIQTGAEYALKARQVAAQEAELNSLREKHEVESQALKIAQSSKIKDQYDRVVMSSNDPQLFRINKGLLKQMLEFSGLPYNEDNTNYLAKSEEIKNLYAQASKAIADRNMSPEETANAIFAFNNTIQNDPNDAKKALLKFLDETTKETFQQREDRAKLQRAQTIATGQAANKANLSALDALNKRQLLEMSEQGKNTRLDKTLSNKIDVQKLKNKNPSAGSGADARQIRSLKNQNTTDTAKQIRKASDEFLGVKRNIGIATNALSRYSGPGDEAAARTLTNALDGMKSTFREGEREGIVQAQGVADRIDAFAGKLRSGNLLGQQARTEYQKIAKEIESASAGMAVAKVLSEHSVNQARDAAIRADVAAMVKGNPVLAKALKQAGVLDKSGKIISTTPTSFVEAPPNVPPAALSAAQASLNAVQKKTFGDLIKKGKIGSVKSGLEKVYGRPFSDKEIIEMVK